MILRRIFILSILLVFFISIFCGAAPQKEPASLKEKIDQYMVRLTENGFSGALLVAKNDEIIISKGYGSANREKKIPVRENTVFTVGSVTKQFTGAAILKLQMQGKLKVTDPITKYFKKVPADKQSITLHHLLTHTAGFPGAIGDDYDPVEREEFSELAMKTRLVHPPGQTYLYSNVGFSLLGIIVELVSGQTYEMFLNENLFKPAGMKETGYLLPEWGTDQLAHGYRGGKDRGTLRDHPWAKEGPGWHLRGNGGILSTLRDMFKWHKALLGNKILDERAKTLYYTPHVPEDESGSSHYGYGWAIFKTRRNTRLIAHNGGNMIFAADFQRYLDEGVVIIAFSNSAGHSAIRASEVVARIVFGESYSLPLKNPVRMTMNELRASAMGVHAAALIDSLGKSQAIAETFIKQHMEPKAAEAKRQRLVAFVTQQGGELGEVEYVEAVQSEEHTIEIKIRSKKSGEWWRLGLGFEKTTPHRIVTISIDSTSPPGEQPVKD
jgi:CubicO group peptidase (beta-lactamase class C family)